ncbi:MAG: TraM recognition domain-containing protein [Rugosibacter sp.]
MFKSILMIVALGAGAWWLWIARDWLAERGRDGLAFWSRSLAYSTVLATMAGVASIFGGHWMTGGEATLVIVFVAIIINIIRNIFARGLNFFRGGQSSGAVRDVTADADYLHTLAKPFDPARLIDIRKGILIGLDGQRKPVFLNHQVIQKNHIEILGESGVGKSSLAGVLLSQLATAGEAVVVFDPKGDRNLPGALARAGKQHGFPVRVLDLRPSADFAQVNPFHGCRPDQVEELLQVALELGKTGDGGVDFYRGKDREATGYVAAALADGKTCMQEIISKAGDDERVTEQENLWRELRQLGRVRALHTDTGLDLAQALAEPGVLYIIGSTIRLEVVACQKLILQRVLQILDERIDQDRPVALFLDELKYLLSPAALRAAGTIRDRNCHLVFAHQSLGDLSDCPGLDPAAVRGAIWGNSGIKVAYKMLDAKTAQELELLAGQVSATSVSHSKNDQGQSVSRSQVKASFMPAHVFTHLPKPVGGEASVGVVFGLGTAFYLSTRWIESGPMPQAERAEAAPTAQPVDLPVAEQEQPVVAEAETWTGEAEPNAVDPLSMILGVRK